MASPRLKNPHITEAQENKETTANEQIDFYDKYLTFTHSVDFTGGNVSLGTTVDGDGHDIALVYKFYNTSNMTAAQSLTFPATARGEFTVQNDNGATHILSVIVGSTTITIEDGKEKTFYTDGTPDGLFLHIPFQLRDIDDVPTPTVDDDGKAVVYDDATGAHVYSTVAGGGGGFATGAGVSLNTLIVADSKADSTAGDDGGGTGRIQRVFVEEFNNISGAVVDEANDEIDLPAGTYEVDGHWVAYAVGLHRVVLRNVTDNTDEVLGVNVNTRAESGQRTQNVSLLLGRFTITADKSYQVLHYITSASATNDDFGQATADTGDEIYGKLRIHRIEDPVTGFLAGPANLISTRVRRTTDQSILATTDTAVLWSENSEENGSRSPAYSRWLGIDSNFTTTFANDEIDLTAHGMITGDGPFRVTTSAADLPAGLLIDTDYYCIRVDADNFQVATSRANALAGTQVTITDDGTGTHTLDRQAWLVVLPQEESVEINYGIKTDADLSGAGASWVERESDAAGVTYGEIRTDPGSVVAHSPSTGALSVSEGDRFKVVVNGNDAFTIDGSTSASANFMTMRIAKTTVSATITEQRKLFHAIDEKANLTAGGSSVAGRQTRTLNTTVTDETNGSVVRTGNSLKLQPGKYHIKCLVPYMRTRETQAFWRNTTDSTDDIISAPGYSVSSTTAGDVPNLHVEGQIELTAEKDFEVEHYTRDAEATLGLGIASNEVGPVEVYTQVFIWKIENGVTAHLNHEIMMPQNDAGPYANSEVLFRYLTTQPFRFLSGAGDSQFAATAAGSEDRSLTIEKNSTSVGTIRYNVSSTGVVNITADIQFDKGDLLEIVGDADNDTTLDGVYGTLLGEKVVI